LQAVQEIISSIENVVPDQAKKNTVEGLTAIFKKIDEKSLKEFQLALSNQGKNWGYQPSNQVARDLLRFLIHSLLGQIDINGHEYCTEALENAKAGKTVVMVSNHLSYGDVNYLHAQLEINNYGNYPLLVMAGPKVYSDPFRILSSMVFDSLKMAQPPSKASEEANVTRRELLDITRTVLSHAVEWQDKGRILYFFPEGSRTRSGGLNELISGVSRYIEREGTLIYPIGYEGTEGLLGVGSNSLDYNKSKITVGPAINYDQMMAKIKKHAPNANHKKFMIDLMGFHIAGLISKEKRGFYSFPENQNTELNEVLSFYLTECQ
jgi:1-acyl-sn-glycerol-3-phosphate acyltransferase